jgi:hypothetical protein
MKIFNLLQFIIGFILGVTLLALGAAGASYLVVAKMTSNPPKPVFAEEEEKKTQAVPVKLSQPPTPKQPKEEKKPTPQPSTEEKEEKEKLPAGAYKARVTWSDGLSLRAEPSKSASRVGGVEYNRELIVLESSRDGQWQKIKISTTGQEAWVKAGNVAKIE